MVEALYLKNKTYLGLATASSTDFTAIMADYYCCQEQFSIANLPHIDSRNRGSSLPSFQDIKAIVNENHDLREQTQSEVFDEDFNSIVDSSNKAKVDLDNSHFIEKQPRDLFGSPLVQDLEMLPNRLEPEVILSKPADFEIPNSHRKRKTSSQRGLFSIESSPQTFLNDFAQQVSSLYPVSPKVTFWCRCEWFYSYIDRGFFTHNDFEECLKVILRSYVEDLTLREWRAIRSLMGKPRRFSSSFLQGEQQRLNKYREAIKALQQGKGHPSNFDDLLPYLDVTSSFA